MTQPVNEPTTERSIGYGRWRTNQLERRPAPGGMEGCDWAYLFWDNGQTIADEDTENISGYSTSAVVGDSINPNEGTGKFEIEATGLYLIQAVTVWVDTFAGDKMASINTSGGQFLQDNNFWENWMSAQNLGTNVDSVFSVALLFVVNVSTDVLADVRVRQTSGSPQDLASIDFSCVRLCDISDPVIS